MIGELSKVSDIFFCAPSAQIRLYGISIRIWSGWKWKRIHGTGAVNSMEILVTVMWIKLEFDPILWIICYPSRALLFTNLTTTDRPKTSIIFLWRLRRGEQLVLKLTWGGVPIIVGVFSSELSVVFHSASTFNNSIC